MQNPHGGGPCGNKRMESANAILPPPQNHLNTDDARVLSRLDYQLRKIHRLHEQARETGIALDPDACARELNDAVKWATRTRP